MEKRHYQIMTKGEIEPGQDLDAVKQRLARLFKTDAGKIGRFFQGKPVCVKGGLDQAAAEKYRQAISKTGLKCGITVQPPPGQRREASSCPPERESPSMEADPGTDQQDCPKCGRTIRFSDHPPDECPHCGIVIQKYIDSQNRKAAFEERSAGKPAQGQAGVERKGNGLAYSVLAVGIAFIAMAVWFHYVKTDEQKQLSDNITSFGLILKFQEAMAKEFQNIPNNAAFLRDKAASLQTTKNKADIENIIKQMSTRLEEIETKRRWIKWISAFLGVICLVGFTRLRQ